MPTIDFIVAMPAPSRRRSMRRAKLAPLTGVLLVGLIAAVGSAQVPPVDRGEAAELVAPAAPTEAWLTERVMELGMADLSVRERATRQLFDSGALNPTTTHRLLRVAPNYEARTRLLDASFRWFVQGPEGALGVEMRPSDRPGGGVTLTRTIPGFDSVRVLRAYDVIVRIDDRPIVTDSSLGNAVRSRRPGDVLTVDIMRPRVDAQGRMVRENGETVEDPMTVEVRLGSWEDLPNRRMANPNRATTPQRRSDWNAVAARVQPTVRRLALPAAERLAPPAAGPGAGR